MDRNQLPYRISSDLDPTAKCKIRRVVFGTMLAGGALGIAGLTAQAHGNASSHSSVSLDWNFDNFVVSRETLVNPGATSSDPLVVLEQELRDTHQAADSLRVLGERATDSLSNRLQNLTQSRLMHERAMSQELSLKQATTQRALTPLSRSVLSQLKAGNVQGGVMLIERAGTPAEVLSAYATVQLDLYNFAAIDGRSTTALTNEIIQICNAAIAYQESHMPGDLVALGGFLHNLASAAMPDVGEPTPEQFRLGRAAAERGLEVRRRSGDPATIGIALYMVGVYSFKAKEYDKAAQQFQESIVLLSKTNRTNDLAWSKAFLGFTDLAQGNAAGTALLNEAKEIFRRSGNVYGIRYLASFSP